MRSPARLSLIGATAALLLTSMLPAASSAATVAPTITSAPTSAAAAAAPTWSQQTVTFGSFTPALLAGPDLAAARDGRLIGVTVRASADLSSQGLSIIERPAGSNSSWRILANTNNFDVNPSLAVSVGGTINVAWLREGVGLRYTSNRTGKWVVEAIPSSKGAQAPSLALTSGGTPSIAYAADLTRTNREIRVVSKTSTGWHTRTIASGGVSSPVLAIDQWSKRYVAYLRTTGSARGLYLATDRTGTWVTTRLSSATDISEPEIALDLQRHVHIAYTRGVGQATRIFEATNRTGHWVTTTATGPGGGYAPALAIDSAGRPRISYSTWPTADSANPGSTPALARWTGTGWTRESISGDQISGRSGYAIDSHDVDHALLFKVTDGFMGGDLIYATTAPH